MNGDDPEQFGFLNDKPEEKKPEEKLKKGVTFTDAKDVIGGGEDSEDMDFGKERESG